MNPIDKAYELIKQQGEPKKIFLDNIDIFKEIYSRKALYIEDLDRKTFEVILFMLENEEQEIFKYFHEDMLSMIKILQEQISFELRGKKSPNNEDIDKIFENIHFYEELSEKLCNICALKNTDDFTKGAVKSYINSPIYRDSISALIIAINKSYFSLSQDKVDQIMEYIKTSNWIKNYANGLEKNTMLDRDFAYQYVDKYLPIKEFCITEEIKEDILLKGILNGKIKDKKLLEQTLDSIDIVTVLCFFDNDLNILFENLKTINYLCEYEKQEIFIKISNKLMDRKNYIYLFRALISGNNPYFNMYMKKEKDMIINFALNDNPLSLSKEEIDYIMDNGYATQNFLDNLKNVHSKSCEINTMDDAINKLREGILTDKKLTSKELKQIIIKIINECLKTFGINIENKIIFCNSKTTGGYYSEEDCLIMINNELIRNFIEKKDYTELFVTIFHEMRHAIQFDRIKKNIFDYDTYIMLKDSLINDYYTKYYSTNYHHISYEMDARKDSYRATFKFLEEYIPEILDSVQNEILVKEKSENDYKNIHVRKMFNELKYESLNNIFDKLIKTRPEIMKQYPIFNIEYNPNGTLKTYDELLQIKSEITENIIISRNMHKETKRLI